MTTASRRAPIVVTHEGGVRFAAQVRSHRVVVDQPVSGGGQDEAPMPLELMAVSLGTCIALYVQQFLHARALPYEGMRVEVEQLTTRNPYRISDFDIRIVLPDAPPPEYREMLERVARSCPAHATLQHPPRVQIAFDTAVPAGA